MAKKDDVGKAEITPIAPGVISVKGIIECPNCHKKIQTELELDLAISDALGEGDGEDNDDKD